MNPQAKPLVKRTLDRQKIERLLRLFRAVGLLGIRQCGKTTLARELKWSSYFDLENPRDLVRLENPQLALEQLQGLIVIDEIQRKPDLFPLIRYLVDTRPKQKYLILGSASINLIKQRSESLAGRIGYHHLGGFGPWDVGRKNWRELWLRGGLPLSYLAVSDEESYLWRSNYITTFLERDIPQLGIQVPAQSLRRFWTMLAHYHGQILNYSELGRSFGMSDMTVRKYVDILSGTLMVRVLQPWHQNVGKRLVKRPKIYIKDSGIFHSLSAVETMDQILSHNKLGASWEGFALECICRSVGLDDHEFYFWSTHSGAEIDLIWQKGGRLWGVECKYQDAPKLSRSLRVVAEDLKPAHIWVVYPGKEKYALTENITVLPFEELSPLWKYDS